MRQVRAKRRAFRPAALVTAAAAIGAAALSSGAPAQADDGPGPLAVQRQDPGSPPSRPSTTT